MKDKTILHLEEQIEIREDDLLRFAQTDLMLYNKHRKGVHTIILTIGFKERREIRIPMGSLDYRVTQVGLGAEDGDEKLREQETAVEKGEEINEIELMFIPLMGNKETSKIRLEKVIRLTKRLKKPQEDVRRMIAMELVLMDKYLTREEMDRYWKEVSMLRIIQYAESKGEEKGKAEGKAEGIRIGEIKGKEKGIIEGRADLIWRMILKKFPKVPVQNYEKIKQMDLGRLMF